jgi:hypothetical protein
MPTTDVEDVVFKEEPMKGVQKHRVHPKRFKEGCVSAIRECIATRYLRVKP